MNIKKRGSLLLNETDIDDDMDDESHLHGSGGGNHGFSFGKLFVTIVVAAPIAAILSLTAIDAYKSFMKESTEVSDETAESLKKVPTDQDKVAKIVSAINKSNGKVASAIKKQTEAINKQTASLRKQTDAIKKLANRKPDIINVEAKSGAAPVPVAPKVIVVKVPVSEKFDLAYEKQKVLDLVAVDLDDPVMSIKVFANVTSKEALREAINSFNAIIKASKTRKGITPFLKKNALSAKKFAGQRLKQL